MNNKKKKYVGKLLMPNYAYQAVSEHYMGLVVNENQSSDSIFVLWWLYKEKSQLRTVGPFWYTAKDILDHYRIAE